MEAVPATAGAHADGSAGVGPWGLWGCTSLSQRGRPALPMGLWTEAPHLLMFMPSVNLRTDQTLSLGQSRGVTQDGSRSLCVE